LEFSSLASSHRLSSCKNLSTIWKEADLTRTTMWYTKREQSVWLLFSIAWLEFNWWSVFTIYVDFRRLY
jgi:hypothetical protein